MIEILGHGVVQASDGSLRSYYGWPSVAKMDNGHLIVVASGDRMSHVCPWGRTVLWESCDQGSTWSEKMTVNDSPIDDRDAGVTPLPDRQMLISWFTSDTRLYAKWLTRLEAPRGELSSAEIQGWNDELMARYLGSFVRIGGPGDGFGEPIEVGVTAPHGPILGKDGELIYFGKAFSHEDGMERLWRGEKTPRSVKHRPVDDDAPILCIVSRDGGHNWQAVGQVTELSGFYNDNLYEPHVVQLPGGRLVGMIRTQWAGEHKFHLPFSLAQTVSDDGGVTWSKLKPLDVSGSPPHLMLHSSGVLICTYGYRASADRIQDVGSGQRVILSKDGGNTWSDPLILRDDGPDSDLGYPATCEVDDGTLFTVYYQKQRAGENCSILSTTWKLH